MRLGVSVEAVDRIRLKRLYLWSAIESRTRVKRYAETGYPAGLILEGNEDMRGLLFDSANSVPH